MRVLALSWRDSSHPEAGGAEKYLETVCAGLSRRGHQVVVSCPSFPGGLPHEIRDGVHYVRFGGRLSTYPASLARLASGIFGRPDVIIDVNNGIPYFAPLVTNIPVVGLVHHVHREQWPVVMGPGLATLGWALESRCAPKVYANSLVVAVSETTREELRSLGYVGDVRVVYNGTEMPGMQRGQRSAHPRLVVLGRLVPHKRVEHAVEVVARLRAHFPEIELLVIGAGWHQECLVRHAADLGVTDRVRFTGFVSQGEKHRLLASSWLHLCPSLKEGWGLSVMEAGWHRVPSVAYQGAGALSESIVDQQSGVLVPPGVTHLAAEVRRIVDSPELLSQLGLGAHRRAREFSWQRTVIDFEQVLTDAMRLGRGRVSRNHGHDTPRLPSARASEQSVTNAVHVVRQRPNRQELSWDD